MNPLEEYPHLFANGKFQAYFDEEIWEIEGVYCGELMLHRNDPIDANGLTNYYSEQQDPEDCTLIARPIEDMTDEEVRNCPTFKKDDITPIEELRYRLFYWTYESYTELMPAIVQNYLLSIGVYSFDQEDFKSHIDSYMNGEPKYRPPLVIDARTLKQEESCQES